MIRYQSMTDKEWLHAECYCKNIVLTETQEEAALEKMAVMIDDGWGINNARHTALSMASNNGTLINEK